MVWSPLAGIYDEGLDGLWDVATISWINPDDPFDPKSPFDPSSEWPARAADNNVQLRSAVRERSYDLTNSSRWASRGWHAGRYSHL